MVINLEIQLNIFQVKQRDGPLLETVTFGYLVIITISSQKTLVNVFGHNVRLLTQGLLGLGIELVWNLTQESLLWFLGKTTHLNAT
jgi:hypothetical protein